MDDRSKVKRHAERGRYDTETVNKILDEGMICHVAFSQDGQMFNIPMIHARSGNSLVLHASIKSRIYEYLATGAEVSITVTLVDGIVLAKSAHHSSLNYRSVVIFGKPFPILGDQEKLAAAHLVVNKIAPGRWEDSRQPTEPELRATGFLNVDINEASAKVREGPPIDDSADLDLPYWTGVIPLNVTRGNPIPAEGSEKLPKPEYLKRL